MYYCDKCNKQFSSKKALYGHKAHCMKKKEVCPICGKEIQRSSFKRYVNSHKSDNYCLECGKRIPHNKKFCSSSCAATYNNKRRKHRKVKKCIQCGRDFIPYNSSLGLFCSTECSTKYRFLKRDKKYLAGKITHMQTLKRHYIYHNKYRCSICGISSWNNKELVLVLDHIDGNSDNNNPENLRLVCPNCDSQLETYKGRNKGKGRYSRRKRYHDGKSF